MEKLFLKTKDSKKIAANLYEVKKPIGWLVLVHMMPATKESWNGLAEELAGLGYESLVIDLRGHGESGGGPSGYLDFSDVEHQAGILDVEAGVEFLKSRGAKPENLALAGASIGANLSLQYLAEHPEVRGAILLSAGLNYRGVVTEPMAKKVKPGQKVLLVSSEDDGRNVSMNQTLLKSFPENVKKELIIYKKSGHGTTMFSGGEKPDLKEKIIAFLKNG